jgi:N-acetylneuraminate lyase
MAGVDEIALASMQLGADWFIGSTYNFMLPLYIQMGKCLEAGDIDGALNLQRKSIEIIGILAKNGYMPAAKFVMSHLGVNVGVARQPFKNLDDEQKEGVLKDLTAAGFFEYANK